MQKQSGPISFSGCVRLKSLIVIQSGQTQNSTVFEIVKGQWQLPSLTPNQVSIERPNMIAKIHQKLKSTDSFSNILRLTGELGIGKTHLALQFAQQSYSQGKFQSVIWMDVQDFHAEALEAQWFHLAAALGLEFSEHTSKDHVITETYQRLLSNGPTLLIFDCAESFSTLAPYLKVNSPHLYILITSRNGIQWTYQGSVLELTPFCEDQALAFLRETLPDNEVEALAPKFKSLAFEVDYHPLRLMELCSMLTNKTVKPSNTVKFQAQFDLDIIGQDEFTFTLLQFCALLCPYQNISLRFFEQLFNNENDFEVVESISTLKEHGFIGYPEQPSTYYIPSVLSHITQPNDILSSTIKLLQTALHMIDETPSPTLQKHIWHLTTQVINNLAHCSMRLQGKESHTASLKNYVAFFNEYLSTPTEEKATQLLSCFNR